MGVVGDGYDYHAGGYGHEHEYGCDDEGLEGYASLVRSARGGVFLSEGRAKRAAAAAIAPAAIMYSVIMVVGLLVVWVDVCGGVDLGSWC